MSRNRGSAATSNDRNRSEHVCEDDCVQSGDCAATTETSCKDFPVGTAACRHGLVPVVLCKNGEWTATALNPAHAAELCRIFDVDSRDCSPHWVDWFTAGQAAAVGCCSGVPTGGGDEDGPHLAHLPGCAEAVASCCGCACGRCEHQGGDNTHTEGCKARFAREVGAS